MELKKRGFLLLELSIALIMVSMLSWCMLDAYKRIVSVHSCAAQKLKALLHLSSYIQALQSSVVFEPDPRFTCSYAVVKKTPAGRAHIIQAWVAWFDEYHNEQRLSLQAGFVR